MADELPDGFDWLESPEFLQLVDLQVVDSARRSNLRNVDDAAMARIRAWLAEHRQGARDEERRRPLSQQRGPQDALASVDRLVRLAAEAALATQRLTLRVSDVEGVYERHYCGHWPMCHIFGAEGGGSREEATVVVGGPGDELALRMLEMARGRLTA
jgi:hypothetical protein